jgi:hypothetical protein
MLGKAIVDGLGLIDVNLDPCPYHILTSLVVRKNIKVNQV